MSYLSEAPKSTRSYEAYNRVGGQSESRTSFQPDLCLQASVLAQETPLPAVPLQIRNAPTRLMKDLGYGKDYAYDPGFRHPVHNVSKSL